MNRDLDSGRSSTEHASGDARYRAVLEWISLCAGLVQPPLLRVATLHRSTVPRFALVPFVAVAEDTPAGSLQERPVDFSLWSSKHRDAYRESLTLLPGAPLAVIVIERLRIKVPVFAGSGDLVPNRRVGRIPGTSKPDDAANSEVAEHRDGFFLGVPGIQ